MNNNGYQNYFVAAIDILGFSQFVRSKPFDYVKDVFTDITNFTELVVKNPNSFLQKKCLIQSL